MFLRQISLHFQPWFFVKLNALSYLIEKTHLKILFFKYYSYFCNSNVLKFAYGKIIMC